MQGRVIAVPQHALGIDVDAVPDQPAHGIRVAPSGREVQRDGVAPVRSDAGGIIGQHRLGNVISLEVERRDEIEF